MADEEAEKRLHSVMDKLFYSPKSKLLTRNTKSSVGTKRGYSVMNELIAESSNSEGNLLAFRGSKRSAVPVGSSSSEIPLCKPWDRGDFIRRLGTFKSMTWFAKPKVVSAVNCARRGWINVDMDIIACEACGARLLFCTPPSWTQQQIEKAAAVFSLKLNDGHRMLCPWIDNACDEKLVQFPPTPAPALVDSYRKRSSALLQLSALPVISSSNIDRMKSPQLVHFLEHSSMLGLGHETVQTGIVDHLGNEHEAVSANFYYQAQKLISLCGWEPRLLPYMVDCRNPSTQSTEDAHFKDLSQIVNGQNAGIIMHSSSGADEAMEVNDYHSPRFQLYDPASAVLDCMLCGASVGLWAFSTVRRPLELIRLVESSEGDGESNVINCDDNVISCITSTSGSDYAINENHFGHNGGIMGTPTSFKEKHMDLNFSIAGGPPPAKQNYRARVSLPIISRYLRTGLESNFSIRDHNMHNHSIPPSDLSNTKSSKQKKDHKTPCMQIIQSDEMGNIKRKGNGIGPYPPIDDGQSCLNHESNEEDVLKSNKTNVMPSEGRPSSELGVPPELAVGTLSDSSNENQTERTDEMPQVSGRINTSDEYALGVGEANTGSRVGDRLTSQDNSMMVTTDVFAQQLDKDHLGCDMIREDTSEARDHVSSNVTSCLDMDTTVQTACKMDLPNADKGFHFGKSSDDQETNHELESVMPIVKHAINNEAAPAQRLGKDPQVLQLDQVMAFDPIGQHRHFCPWIVSNGSAACGWQLTLSALDRGQDSSHLSIRESPDSSSMEVDDPIASVQKLFTSPSKRKKTSNPST